MTSSPHGPYAQGSTRATMATTKGRKVARGSQSRKSCRSSDRSLQRDSMEVESLGIAEQQGAGKAFPGLVHTARQAMGVGCTRSRGANPTGRQAPKVCLVTRVKS